MRAVVPLAASRPNRCRRLQEAGGVLDAQHIRPAACQGVGEGRDPPRRRCQPQLALRYLPWLPATISSHTEEWAKPHAARLARGMHLMRTGLSSMLTGTTDPSGLPRLAGGRTLSVSAPRSDSEGPAPSLNLEITSDAGSPASMQTDQDRKVHCLGSQRRIGGKHLKHSASSFSFRLRLSR